MLEMGLYGQTVLYIVADSDSRPHYTMTPDNCDIGGRQEVHL